MFQITDRQCIFTELYMPLSIYIRTLLGIKISFYNVQI